MKTSTAMTYHFTCTRMARIKKIIASVVKDVAKLGTSHIAGGNGTATLENFGYFFKKLNIKLPYGPAIPLQGTYPKN